jgi:hypothetical protein
MDSHRLTYRGSPAFVGLLRKTLEEEGVTVDGEAPVENRGASEMVQDYVVLLFASGTEEAIRAGIRRFRERSRGSADVVDNDDVDDDDNDDDEPNA